LLWGEGPQGHRIKPLITQHKQNKRHINKSKQTKTKCNIKDTQRVKKTKKNDNRQQCNVI